MAKPINAEKRQSIISLYSDGKSIAAISKLIGVSEPTISKILKSSDIQIRTTNYTSINLDTDEINKLYNDGMSTYEIAKLKECSDETIRKLISTLRPVSERNTRTDEQKKKISQSCKNKWKEQEYVDKVTAATHTDAYKQALSNAAKRNYTTSLGKWISTAESKSIISLKSKEMWSDPKFKATQATYNEQRLKAMHDGMREAMLDPTKRKSWIDKLKNNNLRSRSDGNPWISSTQKQLYYILDISGISYREEGPETAISPFYMVDCIIPKQQNMKRDLIVEVNGEYWHNYPRVIANDKRKKSYVLNNTDYDIIDIGELEMKSFEQVTGKLGEFGLSVTKKQFTTNDITIKRIDEVDAKTFYSVFHYTNTVRKGAITFGAFVGDDMVAAISYTYPMRLETSTRLGCKPQEVMEISRLARQTNVDCKNLGSFLLAKTKKMLPSETKILISFADKTHNHSGGVYKAAGFVADGETKPDYHYMSVFGRYHKKTVWDMAKRMKMSESEYAIKHNLIRVDTKPKGRWILKLRK